jgi:putative protein-disulfide isomerase
MKKQILYYVHDPMCSWCYAFTKTFDALVEKLPSTIEIQYIPGGLAQHSNDPMPVNMQEKLQHIWHQIEAEVGTKFNHDFWRQNVPRRSTYLSCQASIAARLQNKEKEMIQQIQKEYYVNAKNPSNEDTLVSAARKVGLNIPTFLIDLYSPETLSLFNDDLGKRNDLNIHSFPSLVLETNNKTIKIPIDYNSPESILKYISINL